jgi:NAD(P)-dependent dehydrogenase (short-subunit alcohol dehydrogenase family)
MNGADLLRLEGKVAVITGAGHAQGQGAATAKLMSDLGASVVLCDLDEEGVAERAAEIRASGGEAIGVRADVAIEEDVVALMEAAIARFSRIDVLHSQAADIRRLADPGDPDITGMIVEHWREQFETIVLGTMLTCKHAIPHMLAVGGGSIICTSSVSGMIGEPNLTVYAAAKAALHQVVRSVSAQFGKEGIRCNAVAPGLVLSAPGADLGPELIAQYVRHCDTPEVGRPVDIASVVTFLASDASRYISGEVIRVDGGFTSHSPMLAEQRAENLMVGTTSPSPSES